MAIYLQSCLDSAAALFGCLATSTKTILAESLLHGYKFHSINTVYYMSPFATMILGIPALLLEGNGIMSWFEAHPVSLVAVAVLVSWLIFRNPISCMNAVGRGITLLGCTFYGYVRQSPRTPRTPRTKMELLPLVNNDKLEGKV
ncbi:UDP-galactose transporter 1-like [Brassica napus]|uniref:UDP-galactose transporter 1-like n=1 Tax=Brassica napus TaxID=3708 RepID=UPI002079A567|nr:UDP-galactose transporter 1-like [Brassica napus]XP_048615779.1 UDP-galactose transporter 1-like [Brassica napus]